MAAIIQPRHLPNHGSARPALRLVTTDDRRSAIVPAELGLTTGHLVAVVVALVVVLMASLAIGNGALAGLAPGTSTAGASVPAAAGSGATTVAIHAGDSLWTVARRLQPTGDVRPLVDRLIALNGSGPLQPGDRIVVPD